MMREALLQSRARRCPDTCVRRFAVVAGATCRGEDFRGQRDRIDLDDDVVISDVPVIALTTKPTLLPYVGDAWKH